MKIWRYVRTKKIRKKIQEDTFNDPVSTPYGKANSSLRPDSFLKSLVILKMFALAALVQKFVRMTSDFKKLFTGPGKNYTGWAEKNVPTLRLYC